MTTSAGLAGFEQRWNSLAAAYSKAPSDIATEVAKRYTTSIRSQISAVTSGGKLRNVGKRGSRVGVAYTVSGNTALVQATGPLQIIERDTARHTIPLTARTRRARTSAGRLSRKRVATGRVVSGRQPMLINGQWRTGPFNHPGTKGKHPFQRGVQASEVAAVLAGAAVIGKELSKLFKKA